MSGQPLACVILAAGHGSRMKSATPKVLHKIAGKPALLWGLETAAALNPEKIVVVVGPEGDNVAKAAASASPITETAVQEVRDGTGGAAKAALPALQGFHGDVLVLDGDMPFISAPTLENLIAARHKDSLTRMAVLGAKFDAPPAFGRLVLGADGTLERIVEDKDCTPDEKSIKLCKTGAICVDSARLGKWLDRLDNNNAQGEYYLTALPQIAREDGAVTHVHVTYDTDEVKGLNTRADLAALEAVAQQRLRAKALEAGVTLQDRDSVYFSHDTVLGQDVTIEPHVVFGPGVKIADNVHIKAFSHIEGATVAKGATIGPFARLRPGAELGENVKIGNFVEIKKATLAEGVKASHLAYIGDADVGAHSNIGCGAITVNYDGMEKHKTTIGANAMIGSNANLVAPVTIGDGAYIAAGSTIRKDVPADALAVTKADPLIKDGWAARKRKAS